MSFLIGNLAFFLNCVECYLIQRRLFKVLQDNNFLRSIDIFAGIV